MEYILMLIAILFAAANSIVLRIFKNRTFKTHGDVFFFNGGISVVWIVVMSIWYLIGKGGFSLGGVLYGGMYALILCLFLYLKTEALALGPVALTTLISSAAFIVPTMFGVIFYEETVSITQILGMMMIAISLLMCINPKNSCERLTVRWFVYCFAFFLVGGMLGIFYKLFGKSPYSTNANVMMMSASVISALLFFAVGIIINKTRKHPIQTLGKAALPFVLTSGITSCVYIRLNISLSAVIPSAIFFPVSNGVLVLISTVAGYVLFKERLTGVQIAGMILGLLAIAVTGCGDMLIGG